MGMKKTESVSLIYFVCGIFRPVMAPLSETTLSVCIAFAIVAIIGMNFSSGNLTQYNPNLYHVVAKPWIVDGPVA